MQREWDRRWRRKQALKAKLFDEMMGRKPAVYCVGPQDTSLEAEFVREYLRAHPWRGHLFDIFLTFKRDGERISDVVLGDPVAGIPGVMRAILYAVCQAALRELRASDYAAGQNPLIDEAASVTARMREAGIWTGPSR